MKTVDAMEVLFNGLPAESFGWGIVWDNGPMQYICSISFVLNGKDVTVEGESRTQRPIEAVLEAFDAVKREARRMT